MAANFGDLFHLLHDIRKELGGDDCRVAAYLDEEGDLWVDVSWDSLEYTARTVFPRTKLEKSPEHYTVESFVALAKGAKEIEITRLKEG